MGLSWGAAQSGAADLSTGRMQCADVCGDRMIKLFCACFATQRTGFMPLCPSDSASIRPPIRFDSVRFDAIRSFW